MEVVFEHFHPH